MKPIWLFGCALVFGSLGFFIGHRGSSPVAPAPEAKKALARWDGGTFTEADLAHALGELGPQGLAPYREPAALNDFVKQRARVAMLASAARASGLDRSADYQARDRETLAAMFHARFESQGVAEPTEAELLAELEAIKPRLRQPETFRVAQIVLAKDRQRAEALLAEVLEKSASDYHAFSNLAHARSDDPTSRVSGGELEAMELPALEARLGAEAATALKRAKPGEVVPRAFAVDGGFQLVRLLEHLPATEPDVEQLKPQLLVTLRSKKRANEWEKFVNGLETAVGFTVDQAALKQAPLP